jgi:hypothetical protein
MRGIGLVLGPLIGACLDVYLGVAACFFVLAGGVILVAILYLCCERDEEMEAFEEEETRVSLRTESFCDTTVTEVTCSTLFSGRFVMAALCAFVCNFNYSFYEPILVSRLTSMHLSPAKRGLFFCIVPMLLIFSTIFMKSSAIDRRAIMIICCFANFVGLIMSGPTNSIYTMAVGFSIFGLANPLCLAQGLPEMKESVLKKYPLLDRKEVAKKSSGIFTAASGLGQMIGPIYGANLRHQIGFRATVECTALISAVFAVLYLEFGDGAKAFCSTLNRRF